MLLILIEFHVFLHSVTINYRYKHTVKRVKPEQTKENK